MFYILLLVSSAFWVAIDGQTAKTLVEGSNSDLAVVSPEYAGNYTNVILLGWDGVQRDHLFELVNRGMMPSLSAFAQTGKFVNITLSDHITDTKAGWTQILTGYRWWKTGVFSNTVWFHRIPKGYTIPERLENIYGSNQISTAFVTGKLNQMEIEDGTGSAAVGNPIAVYTNEAIYANLPSQLDIVSVGDLSQDRYADVVGPIMLQFLQNNSNNRFFAFFHFSDPDHVGHLYGENSLQYENAIETCDYWLGQILNNLNTLGISQKTLIYITADHGLDEDARMHYNAPYVFLATNDNNVSRNGDEVDVASSIYYGLGLWNQSFNPTLDGYPLQLNLTAAEVEHRAATLADTTNLPAPSISITDNGSNQKIVTFNATDDNLATVFLLVDNTLKAVGPWMWNSTGTVTASGSYNVNTTSLNSGLHSVKILAFDEHGANNGGPGHDPAEGGSPSTSSISFYVGTPPAPSSTPSPFESFSPSPTQTMTSQPSSTPSPSSSPSPTQTMTSQPSSTPPPSTNFKIITDNAFLIIAAVIVAIALLAYLRKKRNK